MIETLLLAGIISKIKHLKIRYLFFTWSVYPALILQLILIYFQAAAFCGNYYFVQFTSIIKPAIMLSFILPMFAFGLYMPAIIGSASVAVGTLLNNFAMSKNNGKMPVFPSLCYITGYVKSNTFAAVHDIHVLGGTATNWKWLTDYIDLGYCILSPGDLFIHFSTFLMLYYTVKAVNLRHNNDIKCIKTKDD